MKTISVPAMPPIAAATGRAAPANLPDVGHKAIRVTRKAIEAEGRQPKPVTISGNVPLSVI